VAGKAVGNFQLTSESTERFRGQIVPAWGRSLPVPSRHPQKHLSFENSLNHLRSTEAGYIFDVTAKMASEFADSTRRLHKFVAEFQKSLRISIDTYSTICYTLTMTKMGRPAKPAKERSSHLVALRLTPAEHKILEQAADKSKLSVSNYIRFKLGYRGDK
jgi:predicted HicB family RNase H-like nuclease